MLHFAHLIIFTHKTIVHISKAYAYFKVLKKLLWNDILKSCTNNPYYRVLYYIYKLFFQQ